MSFSCLLSAIFHSHLESVGFRSPSNSSLVAFSGTDSAPVYFFVATHSLSVQSFCSVNVFSFKLLLNVFLSDPSLFCLFPRLLPGLLPSSFLMSQFGMLFDLIPFFFFFNWPGIWLGVVWVSWRWTPLLDVDKIWRARPAATHRKTNCVNTMSRLSSR